MWFARKILRLPTFLLDIHKDCVVILVHLSLNIVQAVNLLKTSEVANVDQKQTLLVLPHDYVKRFTPQHSVTFQEIDRLTLLISMVGPHERAYNKPYKLVENNGCYHTSVPRSWLRNTGARKGDRIDIYSTPNPDQLLVRLRKVI